MDKIIINNDQFFGKVTALLDEGKRVTIPVKGFSMLPFIRGERDLVELEKPQRPYAADDIVLFRCGGRYVMHRIESVAGDKVTIMGDGVPYNKEHVTTGDICGVAMKILRDGKRPVDPFSPRELRRVHLWRKLLPIRRYLLYAYRLMPWNFFWLRRQYRQASEQAAGQAPQEMPFTEQ